jgi:hypothetical protein
MDIKNNVTFETKCYFNDWEFLLKKGRLSKMISNCNYDFSSRRLFLNNFGDYTEVKCYTEDLIKNNVIDEYFIVSDYAKEAMDFFNLDKNGFKGGYYYSIAELVSIYLCKTDFLLHFSSDAIMQKDCKINWIKSAIELMNSRDDVVVANPTWDFKFKEVKSESDAEDEDWFYSYGFSDQSYLIKTEDFRKDVFNEINEQSERYPKYGGELFEKRVDSYMRNHGLKRITSKHCSYIHKNFPKNKLLKALKLKYSR